MVDGQLLCLNPTVRSPDRPSAEPTLAHHTSTWKAVLFLCNCRQYKPLAVYKGLPEFTLDEGFLPRSLKDNIKDRYCVKRAPNDV